MIKKIIIFMLSCLLLSQGVYAEGENDSETVGVYGSELLMDTSCESLRVGIRMNGNTWRPYYNEDVAYSEVISSEDYPGYSHSGKKAIRFCNAGNGMGRGVFYRGDTIAKLTPGDVYEFTGYFKTDCPDGALVYIINGNGYKAFDGGDGVRIGNTWQKVTARFTVTEGEEAFTLRMNTDLKVAEKASDFSGNTTEERYAKIRETLSKNGSYFMYADDVSFRKVLSDESNIKTIRTSNGTAAVIDKNNNLYMWGENGGNLVSKNDKEYIENPMYMSSDVSDVALGDNHVLILKTDGSVYAKGKNDFGQLGTGNKSDSDEFVFVADGISRISAGDGFSVAVTTDNVMYGWGRCKYNAYGVSAECTSPYKILGEVADVSASGAQTFVIKNDASLWSCGYNGDGQLGLGTYLSPYRFTKITDNVIAVSASNDYTLITKKDNSLWGFGWNKNGAMGSRVENSNVPFKIADDVIGATAGEKASLYIDTSYNLIKLGGEDKGAFGDGEASANIIENGICMSGNDKMTLAVKNGALYGCKDGAFQKIQITNEKNVITLQYKESANSGFDVTIGGINSPENVLLMKCYYKDDILVGADVAETVLDENVTLHINVPEGSDNCRIMIWDGFENMKPLSNDLKIEAH